MTLYFSAREQLDEVGEIERNLWRVKERLDKEVFYPERVRLEKEFRVLQNIYSSYCVQPINAYK